MIKLKVEYIFRAIKILYAESKGIFGTNTYKRKLSLY